MKQPQNHIHCENATQVIWGGLLEVGDTITETDVYDSTTGKWLVAPEAVVGYKVEYGFQTKWVRPSN